MIRRRAFLALVVTPWHALGVDVHVELGGEAVATENSTIAVAPYGPFPWLVSANAFPLCRDRGVRFVQVPGRYRLWDHLRVALAVRRLRKNAASDEPPCDVLVPRKPADVLPHLFAAWPAARLANARFLVLDEGLGSYTDLVTEKKSWFETRPPVTQLRRRLVHELWRIGQRWVASRPLMARSVFHFDPASCRLSLAPDVGPAYARLLRHRAVPLPVRPGGDDETPRALVLTEPNAFYGLYPQEVEARVLRDVVCRLASRGYDVYVKPHPSEDPDLVRSHLQDLPPSARPAVVDPLIMAEALAAGLRSRDVVVGFTTNALISSRLLLGLATFSAARLLLEGGDIPADSPFGAQAAEFRLLATPARIADVDEVPRIS